MKEPRITDPRERGGEQAVERVVGELLQQVLTLHLSVATYRA